MMGMAKLTKQDVLHVAKLAKLDLTDKEVDKFESQLSSVIDFISQLEEIDTKDVEPTTQTTGLENIYRDDEIKKENCLAQDAATSGTDEIHNGYFKVDAILSERSDK